MCLYIRWKVLIIIFSKNIIPPSFNNNNNNNLNNYPSFKINFSQNSPVSSQINMQIPRVNKIQLKKESQEIKIQQINSKNVEVISPDSSQNKILSGHTSSYFSSQSQKRSSPDSIQSTIKKQKCIDKCPLTLLSEIKDKNTSKTFYTMGVLASTIPPFLFQKGYYELKGIIEDGSARVESQISDSCLNKLFGVKASSLLLSKKDKEVYYSYYRVVIN